MIAVMVVNGFSLVELRKLYIDEFHQFYEEMYFVLEKNGSAKEGTYDKIVHSDKGTQVENTVNLLRKQMFKSIAAKNK